MTETITATQQAPIAEVSGIPLESITSNGIPMPTAALITAFTATTLGTNGDEDRYRQVLRDALTIAEAMDYESLNERFSDISDRGNAMRCSICYGTGDVSKAYEPPLECPSCGGSGLK